VNTLAGIKSSTGGDANSVNVDPLFTNAGGILAEDYKTSSSVTTLVATPIVGYETDFAGITRTIPRMGAYENSITTKLTNIEQGNEFSIISNLSGIVVLLTRKSSIELYNINGMLIEKVIADGAYSRNLNNGMYVIRVNGKAVKFIK
jgi:hypothetical protein